MNDSYILGKYDTDNPSSPYYNGIEEDEQELDICNLCLEVDEVFPAQNIETKEEISVCENCSECLDDILT